jgi:hypothetical protein
VLQAGSGARSSLPSRIRIANRERGNVERAALQARIEVAAAASMALHGRAAGGTLHHAWRALG